MNSHAAECFDALYLDSRPTAEAIADAVRTLRELDTLDFSTLAVTRLASVGPAPATRNLVRRNRFGILRTESQTVTGWRFDVFVAGGSGRRRLDWWLCTDRSWAVETGPAVPSYRRIWTFERATPTDQQRAALIEGRSRRVATWLDGGHGPLNPGVV